MLGRTGVAALLALLLLVPSAPAQVKPEVVDTTLYFHLVSIQDFPINTQRPDADWSEQMRYGLTTNTLTCAGNALGQNTLGSQQEYHTWRGYSSPGFVEYDFVQNGEPRVHPERGLGVSVNVSADPQPVVHWFLLADAGAGSVGTPLANVVVHVEARAGDAISIDDKAYDTGPLLMEGRTQPVTLVAGQAYGLDGQPSTQVHGEPMGQTYLYEFEIPLQVLYPTIPRATGFNLRIDAFLDNPACSDPQAGTVMPNQVTPFTDAAHLPRLELRHNVPLVEPYAPQVEAVHEADRDLLLVHWSALSAWGSYDVDVGNLTLNAYGPGEAVFEVAAIVQRLHEHYHLLEAVDFTWVWDLDANPPRDGLYTLVVSVPNLQGTATLESTTKFVLDDGRLVDSEQELPGLGLPALLLGLVALATVLRRHPPSP